MRYVQTRKLLRETAEGQQPDQWQYSGDATIVARLPLVTDKHDSGSTMVRNFPHALLGLTGVEDRKSSNQLRELGVTRRGRKSQ